MKNILVPTDFSPASVNAVHYAAELASFLHADLTILHVYQPPTVTFSEMPLPPIEFNKNIDDIDAALLRLRKELHESFDLKITIHTESRVGSIRIEIKELAKQLDPIFIVMAPHSAGNVEQLLLGSNTIWATRHLNWPLMIVPKDASFRYFKRIGLAWNFRPIKDKSCLARIRQVVSSFGASLHVVCIMKEPSERFADPLIKEYTAFQEEFESLKPHYSFIADKDITKAVMAFSQQNDLDMVIVIPGKHDLLESIFHHSRSKEMALHTQWPLLSVHE